MMIGVLHKKHWINNRLCASGVWLGVRDRQTRVAQLPREPRHAVRQPRARQRARRADMPRLLYDALQPQSCNNTHCMWYPMWYRVCYWRRQPGARAHSPAATCMGASACGASLLLANTSSGTRRPNISGCASSSSSSSRATTVHRHNAPHIYRYPRNPINKAQN